MTLYNHDPSIEPAQPIPDEPEKPEEEPDIRRPQIPVPDPMPRPMPLPGDPIPEQPTPNEPKKPLGDPTPVIN
jgi:hypothetical protein